MNLNVIETNRFFSTERGGQSDCIEMWNRDQIELKKNKKTGVIAVEPPYHSQVCEYPPRDFTLAFRSKNRYIEPNINLNKLVYHQLAKY